MRSPSFVSTSRVPSAFGFASSRVRPAGDTIDPNCTNNVYHGVSFYDINQNCLDVSQNITGQAYNQYGYPIDHYGNPQIGGPLASWAQRGAHGQAYTQPNTGALLDDNGNVLPQNAVAGINLNVMSNCPTDANGNILARNSLNQLAFPPASMVGCDASGHAIDGNGALISDSLFGQLVGNVAVTTPSVTPTVTPQNQALYNAIGPALNTTGAAITSAIQSNNQQQLAQLQAATQLQIAQLQTQAQTAAAQGNLALAQQRLAQLGPLQQLQATLGASTQQNTTLIIVGAIVAFAAIGAAIYFRPTASSAPSRSTRRNPFVLRNPIDGHMRHMRSMRRSRRA